MNHNQIVSQERINTHIEGKGLQKNQILHEIGTENWRQGERGLNTAWLTTKAQAVMTDQQDPQVDGWSHRQLMKRHNKKRPHSDEQDRKGRRKSQSSPKRTLKCKNSSFCLRGSKRFIHLSIFWTHWIPLQRNRVAGAYPSLYKSLVCCRAFFFKINTFLIRTK